MSNFIQLENRSLIFINGADHLTFLQGLVSNDVNKATENKAIYSLMLNPQGRFLFEFFAVKYQDGLILEVAKEALDVLVKKLSFYKLRSLVEIKKLDDLSVFFVDDSRVEIKNEVSFFDPRKENFGKRIYAKKEDFLEITKNYNLKSENLGFYHYWRLQNKIVDENDLVFDQSLIVEYGFDDFNAIDYKKGCYVGQEIVARSHYKGQIRKKIFLVEIHNLSEIEKDGEITCGGKKQGVILSSLFYKNQLIALALIKNLDLEGKEINLDSLDLISKGQKITIKG